MRVSETDGRWAGESERKGGREERRREECKCVCVEGGRVFSKSVGKDDRERDSGRERGPPNKTRRTLSYVSAYRRMYVHVNVSVCACACMCVCVCVCLCTCSAASHSPHKERSLSSLSLCFGRSFLSLSLSLSLSPPLSFLLSSRNADAANGCSSFMLIQIKVRSIAPLWSSRRRETEEKRVILFLELLPPPSPLPNTHTHSHTHTQVDTRCAYPDCVCERAVHGDSAVGARPHRVEVLFARPPLPRLCLRRHCGCRRHGPSRSLFRSDP